MLVSEMVSYITKNNPDWDTVIVLSFIDEIQRRMLSHPLKTREVFAGDGKHPQIVITNDLKVYPIEDAIHVASVYACDVRTPIDYSIIPQTEVKPLEIQIIGDYEGTVRVQYYKKPSKVSFGTELEIPQQYHYNTVIKGVQGLIDENENGAGTSEEMLDFERNRLSKFWHDMNWESRPRAMNRKSSDRGIRSYGYRRGYR